MREAAIVSTARTAIGKAYRGAFNATEAPVLAAHVMRAAVERAGIDPTRIDDVFWGVGNHGGRPAPTVAEWRCSPRAFPTASRPFTLDRKCGSGLTALALAARSIIADEVDVALSGGMESISFTVTKDAPRFANQSVLAEEPAAYIPMIETAVIVAERYGISRERRMPSPRRASSAPRRGSPAAPSPTRSCRSPSPRRCSTGRATAPAARP